MIIAIPSVEAQVNPLKIDGRNPLLSHNQPDRVREPASNPQSAQPQGSKLGPSHLLTLKSYEPIWLSILSTLTILYIYYEPYHINTQLCQFGLCFVYLDLTWCLRLTLT